MKKPLLYIFIFIFSLCAPLLSRSQEKIVPEAIIVEGVASSPQAAPIAALREIDGRLRGLSFTVIDGKYVNFEDQAPAAELETRGKRIVGVEKLKTGLYRATMEVRVGEETIERLDRLPEKMVEGRAEVSREGNLLVVREKARRLASEKAVLKEVGRRYPGRSAPNRLAGKIYFLGSIRERLEDSSYVLLARIKVRLIKP